MTSNTDILTQLRREWQHVGRSPLAHEALEHLRRTHPLAVLGGLEDLCDVVDALEVRSRLNVLERADVVRILLIESNDALVRRALLQTLLPGIVSVCRQLRFGDGIVHDPGETLSVALSLATELLTEWAGQSRQYCAPDILSALRGRLRRWLLKEKNAARALSTYEHAEPPAGDGSPLLTRLASYRGSQYDRLARLTYARVFEGRSLQDLAHSDHSAPRALQAELQVFAINHLL